MEIGICDATTGFEQGTEVHGLRLEKAKGIYFPLPRGSAEKLLCFGTSFLVKCSMRVICLAASFYVLGKHFEDFLQATYLNIC